MLYLATFLLAAIAAGVLSVAFLERIFLEALAPRWRGPRQVGAANPAERARIAVARFWRALCGIRLRA